MTPLPSASPQMHPSTAPQRHAAPLRTNLGGESGELVNRNCLLLLQDIMFCVLWVKCCSPVHLDGKMAVLARFEAFFFIYFTIYCLYIYV